jgi:hypothetical protein
MSATLQTVDANAEERELTDGFNLMIDALLNGLTTSMACPASRSRISAAWPRPRASA